MHGAGMHGGCGEKQPKGQHPSDQSDPGESGCGCQSHLIQAKLGALDAVPSADIFHSLCLLTAAVSTGSIEFDQIGSEHRFRPADPAFAGKVRAQSLYARHCLLLI